MCRFWRKMQTAQITAPKQFSPCSIQLEIGNGNICIISYTCQSSHQMFPCQCQMSEGIRPLTKCSNSLDVMDRKVNFEIMKKKKVRRRRNTMAACPLSDNLFYSCSLTERLLLFNAIIFLVLYCCSSNVWWLLGLSCAIHCGFWRASIAIHIRLTEHKCMEWKCSICSNDRTHKMERKEEYFQLFTNHRQQSRRKKEKKKSRVIKYCSPTHTHTQRRKAKGTETIGRRQSARFTVTRCPYKQQWNILYATHLFERIFLQIYRAEAKRDKQKPKKIVFSILPPSGTDK